MTNPREWIATTLVAEGFSVPEELKVMIGRTRMEQPPIFFLNDVDGRAETASMHRQFPTHQILAFARRADDDGVVCVVLADPVYPRGHVLVLHDDRPAGHEVDKEYPSLEAWAKDTKAQIEERIRMGWNDGIEHLLARSEDGATGNP